MKFSKLQIKVGFGLVVILILTLSMSTLSIAAISNLSTAGEEIQIMVNEKDRDVIVFEDGTKITNNDIKSKMILQNAMNDDNRVNIENDSNIPAEEKQKYLSQLIDITYEDAKEDLLRSEIFYQEAKRLGIQVSEQEAASQLDAMDNVYADIFKNGNEESQIDAKNVIQKIDDYRKALGMSEDKYRSLQIETYSRAASIKKLENQYLMNLRKSRNISSKDITAELDKYYAELKNSAKFTVVES